MHADVGMISADELVQLVAERLIAANPVVRTGARRAAVDTIPPKPDFLSRADGRFPQNGRLAANIIGCNGCAASATRWPGRKRQIPIVRRSLLSPASLSIRSARRCEDFEYTPECATFDLLGIRLLHGWLVDPEAVDVVSPH